MVYLQLLKKTVRFPLDRTLGDTEVSRVARKGSEKGDDPQKMTLSEALNEAHERILTVMTDLVDPLKRKGTRETVT